MMCCCVVVGVVLCESSMGISPGHSGIYRIVLLLKVVALNVERAR